jgi:hypothetical protein
MKFAGRAALLPIRNVLLPDLALLPLLDGIQVSMADSAESRAGEPSSSLASALDWEQQAQYGLQFPRGEMAWRAGPRNHALHGAI